MFSKIADSDFVENLEKSALNGPIKKDRLRYRFIYECIEEFVHENDLIISDLDSLEGIVPPFKDFYSIYSKKSL